MGKSSCNSRWIDGLLILAPLALLSPVWLSGRALFWGTAGLQFAPWWVWAWRSLSGGELPLWNPLAGMGSPLLANYQSALLYPPVWGLLALAALGGAAGLAWGQALYLALHLAWAGLGMRRLARAAGLGVLAQGVSGLAFGLAGYWVGRGSFLSIVAAGAWLPWVLLGVMQLGWERGAVVRLGAVLGMQLLAGHAQTAWYTWLLAGMWGLVWRGCHAYSQYISTLESAGNCLDAPLNKASLPVGESADGLARPGGATCLPASGLLAGRPLPPVGVLGNPTKKKFSSFFTQFWETWRGEALHAGREDGKGRLSALIPAWLPALGRLALAGVVALGLGLALAAAQLLPTAEYLLQSPRADQVAYGEAMLYSFWPWRLIGLVAPDFFGNPARGDFWGYATFWEDAVYIGLLPLLLAGRALLRHSQTPIGRRLTIPLAALIGLAFILAFGQNTPVFPWLYAHVPTFDMFKAPARFSLWAVFAFAFLAGLGLQGWQRPTGRALYWTRLATAGAGAVTLGGALAWFVLAASIEAYRLATMVGATCLAGVWGLGAGLLALSAPPSGQPLPRWGWWQTAVLAWVTLDLLVAGWGLNPGIAAASYAGASASATSIGAIGAGRLYLPPADERALKFERYFDFRHYRAADGWAYLRDSLLPNLFLLDGLASANQFDPLVPARYARWMEALDRADAATQAAMLRLMGVGIIERVDESRPAGVRFDAFDGADRFRWFGAAQLAADESEAWQMILAAMAGREGAFDPEAVVLLEDGAIPAGLASAGGRAEVVDAGNNQLVVRTQADGDGWLFVADVWYPGWQAWVDGRPAPVLRADYLFRAVAVPAGAHTVVMAYRPRMFYVGVGLSLAAVGVMVVFSLSTGRRSWPTRRC